MVHQPGPTGTAETGHYRMWVPGELTQRFPVDQNIKFWGRGKKLYRKYISEPKFMIIQFSTEFTQCCIISVIFKRIFASPADNHMHFRTALEFTSPEIYCPNRSVRTFSQTLKIMLK